MFDFESAFKTASKFGTAAGTLVWIADPDRAIEQMKKAVKPGGRIVILD